MQVTVKVNQKEAIRRGYNCNSTVKLDVDVTTLTEPQRQRLAQWFHDGELKINYTCAEIPTPTVDGLIEFLNADIEAVQKAEEKNKALKAEEEQKIAEFRQSFDANPRHYVKLNTHSGNAFACLDHLPYVYNSGTYPSEKVTFFLTPPQREVFEQIEQELLADYEAALAKARAEREAKEKEEAERLAAADARLKAQLEAWVNQRNDTLKERHAAGFTTEAELRQLIINDDLAERDLTFTGDNAEDWGREDLDTITHLTDEQFLALKKFKAALPEGAVVRLYEMWNHEKDNGGDTIDDTKVDRIIVADATYAIGEIEASADQQIGTLPDINKDEEND